MIDTIEKIFKLKFKNVFVIYKDNSSVTLTFHLNHYKYSCFVESFNNIINIEFKLFVYNIAVLSDNCTLDQLEDANVIINQYIDNFIIIVKKFNSINKKFNNFVESQLLNKTDFVDEKAASIFNKIYNIL